MSQSCVNAVNSSQLEDIDLWLSDKVLQYMPSKNLFQVIAFHLLLWFLRICVSL